MSMYVKSLPLVLVTMLLAQPCAAEYSAQVKEACKRDYKKYCGIYALKDPGLKQCMDRAGRSLTQRCVDALVASGEVTKERAAQRWKKQ